MGSKKVSELRTLWLSSALSGLVCASSAGAQELDMSKLPAPMIDLASCAEVVWAPQILALFPRIGEACQQVVLSEGVRWARFDADFVGSNTAGRTVRLDFKNRQGRTMERLTLTPRAAQRLLIDGQRFRARDVESGQQLNVYVPEKMFAPTVSLGAIPAE